MLAPKTHPQMLHSDDALLVVIDMQEPFLRGIHDSNRLTKSVGTLIQGANVLRVPIVSTVQNLKAMGDVVPEIKKLLPPMLPPFDKMTFSCYSDPGFASELNRSSRKQIILCGIETHICVSQTALGLTDAGFQVHVVADAVSSRTVENWRVGLERIRQGGGLVTSVESALFEMLREAGTPDFREILNLIK